jgi:hypothetical protein
LQRINHRPPDYGSEDLVPSLLRCLTQALRAAAEFVSVQDLLHAVSVLPTAMHDRFRSWILALWGDGECLLPTDEVVRAIRSRLPTGDDLMLLDAAVRRCRPESYADRWSDALGEPPSVTDVGSALAAKEVPEAWKRAFD